MLFVPGPLYGGPKSRITDPSNIVQLNRATAPGTRITRPTKALLNRAFNPKKRHFVITDTLSIVQLNRAGD